MTDTEAIAQVNAMGAEAIAIETEVRTMVSTYVRGCSHAQ